MNRELTRIGLIALLVFNLTGVGAAFEGVVDYELRDAQGKTQRMRYELKGSMVRSDISLPKGKKKIRIFDASKDTGLILYPQSKTAVKLGLDKTKARRPSKPLSKVTITKGGRDVVAGVACDIYTMKRASETTEICACSNMGEFPLAQIGKWQTEVQKKRLFPLRVIVRSGQYKKKPLTFKATRIVKKSFPDSHFNVPSGYKVVKGSSAEPKTPKRSGIF